MHRWCARVGLVVFVLALGTNAVSAQAKPNPYLNKDGTLKAKLHVSDLQSGGIGISGTKWAVEPSGKWRITFGFGNDDKVLGQGVLSKRQLSELAADLDKYHLSKLRSRVVGRPGVNPRGIEIRWGRGSINLTLHGGSSLPTPDPRTMLGSYAGVLEALRNHLQPEGYLDGSGNLAQELRVQFYQRTGREATSKTFELKPDGDWTLKDIGGKTLAQGKLTEQHLSALAKEFERFDMRKVPTQTPERPTTDSISYSVRWGQRNSSLGIANPKEVPAADPKTVEGRFSGIFQALERTLQPK